MPAEKSAEAIVVETTRRRAEPIESRELRSLEALWQKPRKRASVEMQGPEARVINQVPLGAQGPDPQAESDGTAGYGTVRPVVWEDGGG